MDTRALVAEDGLPGGLPCAAVAGRRRPAVADCGRCKRTLGVAGGVGTLDARLPARAVAGACRAVGEPAPLPVPAPAPGPPSTSPGRMSALLHEDLSPCLASVDVVECRRRLRQLERDEGEGEGEGEGERE